MQPEWWENFFNGMALDLWRQAVTPDQTRAQADFIEKALAMKPPASVLDVPCGNGRLSLELAARGYRVTGIDITQEFVEEARAGAAARKLSGRWEQGDMRDLSLSAEFDGAFCFGNSFGYFEDEGNARFLAGIARALKPGARFALDAGSVAENILPRFEERTSVQVGDILFQEENSYDHVGGRYDTEYTFVRGGKVEKKRGSHRIYTYRQMIELLEAAGFAKAESYGSLSMEPYKLGSSGLFLVTTRRGS